MQTGSRSTSKKTFPRVDRVYHLLSRAFPSKKGVVIASSEPLSFKFLYAKENDKLEINMEL